MLERGLTRYSSRSLKATCVIAAVLLITTGAFAEEVIVQNDSVTSFATVAIQSGFVAGESGAVWLQSPCNGTIVGVQIFWKSYSGAEPDQLEDSITIFSEGVFPNPGPVKQNDYPPYDDAIMLGPVMHDGALNEFRELDSDLGLPLRVPVAKDEIFVVSFKFYNSPDPYNGPSIVTDTDGCQPGKNGIDAQGLGWYNACWFGVSGDFLIRAVVECPGAIGACCHTDGTCTDEVEQEDCQEFGDIWYEEQSCLDINCPNRGACCRAGGCLQLVEQSACEGPLAGVYAGDGTDCEDDVCIPGACCSMLGDCTVVLEAECDGIFRGPGTDCDPNPCEQPLGACCFGTYCQGAQPEDNCIGAGGLWVGPFTDCDPNPCESCAGIQVGDFNVDGVVDGEDIQGFVDEFLSPGAPGSDGFCRADIDANEVLDNNDILEFVACLTSGACP